MLIKLQHLVAGPDISPDRITFTSSAYAQLRLSHLDAHMFQVPKYLSAPTPAVSDGELFISDCLSVSSVSGRIGNLAIIRHNHFVSMKPAKAPVLPPDDDGIDLFHPAIQRGGDCDMLSLLKPKTMEMFNQTQHVVAEENKDRKSQPGDDVSVTPLGTSSAMPSKYRNGEVHLHIKHKALK